MAVVVVLILVDFVAVVVVVVVVVVALVVLVLVDFDFVAAVDEAVTAHLQTGRCSSARRRSTAPGRQDRSPSPESALKSLSVEAVPECRA